MEVIYLDDAIVKAMDAEISAVSGEPQAYEIRAAIDAVLSHPAAMLTLICEYDLFDRIPQDDLQRFGALAGSASYWTDRSKMHHGITVNRQTQTAEWGYFIFDAAVDLITEMIMERIDHGGWRPAA
jgi:hypothetical protein